MAGILDVDLARFDTGGAAERRAIVDGVRRSLETGFVFLSSAIEPSLIDRAYALLGEFFGQPAEQKDRLTVAGSKGQVGYTGTLVETAAQSDHADWKEMLNWGRAPAPGHPLRERYPHRYMDAVLPEETVPGIQDALLDLHDEMLQCQRRFLRIVALGLGCAEGYFDTLLADGPTLTRAIRYPPMAAAPAGGHVWAEEHLDINLTTLLPRATARGLQMRGQNGWEDVAPPDGAAILNTGMMLERITNGRISAGVHRVVGEPGSSAERMSVVQFCHPTPWSVLAPLPTCIDVKHPIRWPPITAADWLDQVLHEIGMR